MTPTIKRFHSPDITDLEHWTATCPDGVCFLLEMEIGPRNGSGADIFEAMVVSKEALRLHRHKQSFAHVVLFPTPPYDWPTVRARVEGIVAQCDGDDWDECTRKLRKHFAWEFDDYRP